MFDFVSSVSIIIIYYSTWNIISRVFISIRKRSRLEIRTHRHKMIIRSINFFDRISLNLPVFFEHPMYTRSPSLHKCGSFHCEMISWSSWWGTGTRDLAVEWRRSRVFERGIISPLVSHPPDHLNIFHSERTLGRNYRAQTFPPPSWKLSWCIIDIRVIGTIPFSRQTVERLLYRAV